MSELTHHYDFVRFVIFWIVLPTMTVLWAWFLLHAYPKLGQFAWQLFCDSQGKPGWGRIGSWFALNAVILWVTHIVWKTEKIPDLFGPLFFVGGLYAIEKLPEFAAAIKGIKLPDAQASSQP